MRAEPRGVTGRRAEPDALTRFLRCCAAIDLDDDDAANTRRAASDVRDWSRLADRAEEHGLAPLVRQHARMLGIDVPAAVSTQLTALAIRHRAAAGALTASLLEIADRCTTRGIEFVVLKGGVLAHDIYSRPELRPARDLDLLVAPADADRTMDVLRALGFRHSGEHTVWAHHHLPAVSRVHSGYTTTVEVHLDAISFDQAERLTLSSAREPLRAISISGQHVPAFGHTDMLRHLTAHLLEPRTETRLIGVADLVGYAVRHVDAIDWSRLRHTCPRVTNTLSLIHLLRPSPPPLRFLATGLAGQTVEGVGFGLAPLGEVSFRDAETLRRLIWPPDWWMHAYYGIPPGGRLAPARWRSHLPMVTFWALRRAMPATRIHVRTRLEGVLRGLAAGR